MNTDGKTLRPRWRISTEVASELVRVRRQSVYQSWDDFYRALLRKWQEMPMPLSEPRPMKDDPVAAKLERLEAKLATLLTFAESQSQKREADQTGQERMAEVVRRIHDLLALALHASESPDEVDENDESLSPAHRAYLKRMRKNNAGLY